MSGSERSRAASDASDASTCASPDAVLPSLLIVDAQEVARARMQTHLKQVYRITTCDSGLKAWELVCKTTSEDKPFDAIIANCELPDLDGMALLRRVKMNTLYRGVVVVLVSSQGNDAAADAAVSDGADDYVQLPVGQLLLRRRLEAALSRRHLAQHRNEAIKVIKHLKSSLAEKDSEIELLREYMQVLDDKRQLLHSSLEEPIGIILQSLKRLTASNSQDVETTKELHSVLKSLARPQGNRPVMTRVLSIAQVDGRTMEILNDEMVEQQTTWRKAVPQLEASQQQQSGSGAGRGSGAGGSSAADGVAPDIKADATAATLVLQGAKTLPSSPASRQLDSWHLNLWCYEPDALMPLIEQMFTHFDLLNKFSIPQKQFQCFLASLRTSYIANPFHNWHHAFDVTHAAFMILNECKASRFLTDLDILALLVASLCHDVEHPGLSNAFHVSARTTFALLYNDQSVLENHHCTRAFVIAGQTENNIFVNLAPAQFRRVRQLIISCILATDMAQHARYLDQFQAWLDGRGGNTAPATPEDLSDEERSTLMQIIIKAADISNTTKPWPIAVQWSLLLCNEFHEQAKMEAVMNVPVSYKCSSVREQAKLVQGFMQFCAVPLYQKLTQWLPDAAPMVARCNSNVETWEEIAATGAPPATASSSSSSITAAAAAAGQTSQTVPGPPAA